MHVGSAPHVENETAACCLLCAVPQSLCSAPLLGGGGHATSPPSLPRGRPETESPHYPLPLAPGLLAAKHKRQASELGSRQSKPSVFEERAPPFAQLLSPHLLSPLPPYCTAAPLEPIQKDEMHPHT
jgi:hypothetical protein